MSDNARITVKPGWVIKDTSSASGGVHYARTHLNEETVANRLEAEFRTRKSVDHVVIVHDLDAVVKRVDYALRKFCTKTVFGWYGNDAALAAVRSEVSQIQDAARVLNETAARLGSAHRAHIGIVPTYIDPTTPEAAEEIARTVRETLGGIQEALRAGEVGTLLQGRLLKAKNLEKLGTGFQGEAIRFALEAIGRARTEIREKLKEGEGTPLELGAAVNLDAVETAIQLFSPLPETFEGVSSIALTA